MGTNLFTNLNIAIMHSDWILVDFISVCLAIMVFIYLIKGKTDDDN